MRSLVETDAVKADLLMDTVLSILKVLLIYTMILMLIMTCVIMLPYILSVPLRIWMEPSYGS